MASVGHINNCARRMHGVFRVPLNDALLHVNGFANAFVIVKLHPHRPLIKEAVDGSTRMSNLVASL